MQTHHNSFFFFCPPKKTSRPYVCTRPTYNVDLYLRLFFCRAISACRRAPRPLTPTPPPAAAGHQLSNLFKSSASLHTLLAGGNYLGDRGLAALCGAFCYLNPARVVSLDVSGNGKPLIFFYFLFFLSLSLSLSLLVVSWWTACRQDVASRPSCVRWFWCCIVLVIVVRLCCFSPVGRGANNERGSLAMIGLGMPGDSESRITFVIGGLYS